MYCLSELATWYRERERERLGIAENKTGIDPQILREDGGRRESPSDVDKGIER